MWRTRNRIGRLWSENAVYPSNSVPNDVFWGSNDVLNRLEQLGIRFVVEILRWIVKRGILLFGFETCEWMAPQFSSEGHSIVADRELRFHCIQNTQMNK